ncbi:MAG: CopG family transcriptional regulator [Elusimicrobiota bacterium]|nr:CopG family transcriptional regulator [Elusimicrobiota bacterium]
MMRKIKDLNMPIGKMIKINDFLPPPEKLAVQDENVKITISLSKASVQFFKQKAKKYHTKYQKMIRNLIDRYASHHVYQD